MANNSVLLNSSATNEVVVCQKRQNELSSLTKINPFWIKTAKQLTAGAISGCCEVLITYPTDYVKIMLQLDDRSGQQKRFKNSFDVMRQTIRSHGILGVYRGFSVVFYGAFPKYTFRSVVTFYLSVSPIDCYFFSRFGSYEQIKRFYVDEKGQLRPRDKLICGLGAGIIEALFAVIPQESIRVKFINDRCSDKPRYKGLFHGIREIIREKGIRGTYQGVTPTLLKQGSNQAIRFSVFDSLNEWYEGKEFANSANSKVVMPIFGAIAGAISVLGNTPLDVIKTRMQGLEAHRFKGTWDCIQQIYRNEGLLAFYKGIMPRMTKVTLEVAIAFTAYNTLLDLFKSNS